MYPYLSNIPEPHLIYVSNWGTLAVVLSAKNILTQNTGCENLSENTSTNLLSDHASGNGDKAKNESQEESKEFAVKSESTALADNTIISKNPAFTDNAHFTYDTVNTQHTMKED